MSPSPPPHLPSPLEPPGDSRSLLKLARIIQVREKFTSLQRLNQIIADLKVASADPPPSIIFTEIPKSQVPRLLAQDSPRLPPKTVHTDAGFAIFKMLSDPHKSLSREFERLILYELYAMGLAYPPYLRGGATRTFGPWVKEPDCSLSHTLNGPIKLVIETGYSETPSRLRLDARGWLEVPGSEVQAVFTLGIDQKTPRITITEWRGMQVQATRSTRIRCTQNAETTMTRTNNTSTASGPLNIDLEILIGRPPTAAEHNVVLPPAALIRIAEFVWTSQGFM